MKPNRQDAYSLLHEGTLALADVERNGFRIDVAKLDKTIEEVSDRIKRGTESLKKSEVWKVWKKRFADKANPDSRYQLGKVFFEDLGFEAKKKTKTGRPKTDEEALGKLDHPFIKRYLVLQKLKKLRTTYLKGIRKEVCDGYLHTSINLHLVSTFRSSSDSPNLQNIPIRDKKIGKLVRSCFIPRDNHVLVETDYDALEFKVCSAFWNDPVMVEYASDPKSDVHRDMACECYILGLDEVTKDSRFYAKNQFVFPQLYGSNYVNCSRNLWNAIEEGNLKTAAGVGLKKHLKEKGITQLGYCDHDMEPIPGTFEYHIKKAEHTFLDKFETFAEKKTEWWNNYQATGGFNLLTGFRINGVFSKNFLLNAPIQGTAFHILLWSLIQLNKWLIENKMRSVIIGQIHDSIIFDIHKDELSECLAKIKQVMTEDVRNYWEWIIVPLTIGAELSETNWYEKKEIEI